MATTLTYNQSMLLAVRTALKEAVQAGAQSGSVSSGGGTESYTRYSLAQLRDMEREYALKVNREAGFTGRTQPDFGGCS